MDTYQPIYDAIAAATTPGFQAAAQAAQEAAWSHERTAQEMRRPSVLFRPTISMDGNKWCVLYGENLHDGVAGFGDTPEKAMMAFDLAWLNEKAGHPIPETKGGVL